MEVDQARVDELYEYAGRKERLYARRLAFWQGVIALLNDLTGKESVDDAEPKDE